MLGYCQEAILKKNLEDKMMQIIAILFQNIDDKNAAKHDTPSPSYITGL